MKALVLLFVDTTAPFDKIKKLQPLRSELVRGGWTVIRHDIGREDTIERVKWLIEAESKSHPEGFRRVLLFGPRFEQFQPAEQPIKLLQIA